MDADNWIALAAAVVALIAALLALWQAGSARRQADAAEEGVALLRRQIDEETAARDEAAGPMFAVKEAVIYYDGEQYVSATIVMNSGPPLRMVTARVRGVGVRHLIVSEYGRDILKAANLPHLSAGAEFKILVEMEYNVMSPYVTIDLECAEEGGQQRKWSRSCTATPIERPEPTSKWR